MSRVASRFLVTAMRCSSPLPAVGEPAVRARRGIRLAGDDCSPYTQSFNGLNTLARRTRSAVPPVAVDLTESGGSARDNEQYAANTGSDAGQRRHLQLRTFAALLDRALGGLRGPRSSRSSAPRSRTTPDRRSSSSTSPTRRDVPRRRPNCNSPIARLPAEAASSTSLTTGTCNQLRRPGFTTPGHQHHGWRQGRQPRPRSGRRCHSGSRASRSPAAPPSGFAGATSTSLARTTVSPSTISRSRRARTTTSRPR